MTVSTPSSRPAILLIGASRGIGLAMATALFQQGWRVVGTALAHEGRTALHELADTSAGRVEAGLVDICEPAQITALRARLAGRVFDVLFVNAGTANANPNEAVGEASTDAFQRVMATNALGPMRCIEALQDLVPPDGLIGAMSSGQGSVADNTRGGFEVYRCSKAALNQAMRSYAARHANGPRALLLLAPGWIRTALGGPQAPFSLDETVPDIVRTLLAKRARPGLEYLDRLGQPVAW